MRFPAAASAKLGARREADLLRVLDMCSEEDQLAWTAETLRVSRTRIGVDARMTLVEWGTARTDSAIPQTVERLGLLYQQLGVEGAIYYKWADSAADDPQWAYPTAALVKARGSGYVYHPVQPGYR